tara:strand:- start:6 stop:551 length:546 start_codon:yes stop_codon:yes gene_type:complete
MALTQVAAGLLAGSITSSQITSVAASTLTGTQTIPRGTLPTGSVLQVVSVAYSTQTSNNTGSYAATGVTLSITPTSSSSKILVFVSGGDAASTSPASGVQTEIRRGGTALATFAVQGPVYIGANGNFYIGTGPSINYLDSPATTSSTTYATFFKPQGGAGATATVQRDGTTSSMTLMEISA